jgi:uncharacterized membrane-anchored protein
MPLRNTPLDRSELKRLPGLAKVPEITAVFWILKLLTTAGGESASDFLLITNPAVGLPIGVVGFALTLWLQFRTPRYSPVAYWAAVAMVAVFGTMIADVLKVGLDVPLAALTIIFAVALAATFLIWHLAEGTLSIHSITTRRREAFYWLTVSFTFALGTAAGDLTADTLGLGYFGSIVLFAVVMAVPVLGRYGLGLNSVIAFWFAYIVTRPLGASIADWLAKPSSVGGVGMGDGVVAMILLLTFVAVLTVVVVRHRDVDANAEGADQAESQPDNETAGV